MPTPVSTSRRAVLSGLAAGLTLNMSPRAWAADEPVRIGVLGDQSGPFADVGGLGAVEAARLAVEDFGGSVLGRPIEVLSGDHQNKTDIGVAIAREWLGPRHVGMILDMGNSAIALALQGLVRDAGRIAIPVSAVSSDLTGKACSPNTIQWAQDNWSNSVALIRALRAAGNETFFFITVDYAFGISLEQDATAEIKRTGGRVVGGVRHPLGAHDFSAFLLAAQASGAQAVVLASAGADVVNLIAQASEFGLTQKQTLTAPSFYLTDIHAVGLQKAQGITVMQSWYWDSDDTSRAYAQRFFARRGKMPNDVQAADWSATTAYLKAVKAAGTQDAGPVLAAMKAATVDDLFTHEGHVRADNKMVFDRLLMRVKTPAESTKAWDYLKLVARVPAAQAFRPLSESVCPLVAHS